MVIENGFYRLWEQIIYIKCLMGLKTRLLKQLLPTAIARVLDMSPYYFKVEPGYVLAVR
jgi:hypothetical protein